MSSISNSRHPQSQKKSEEKEDGEKKNLKVKKDGLVAYTEDGYLLIVYQNVLKWSFPKGHFDKKFDETILDTAIREFREETNYTGYIDPSRLVNKMRPSRDVTLFLLEITPDEVGNIELIDGVNVCNDEILQSMWIYIGDFETFRQSYFVNKTISNFNIKQFLLLSGLKIEELEKIRQSDGFSFGKTSRNSRKTTRKSRKTSRNTTRKSIKTTRKSRKTTRKSRKTTRKSRKTSRKARKASRKSS